MLVIGHSAYSGANAMKICATKTEAIKILRSRGVTRDVARKAVKAASSIDFGYQVVRVHTPGFTECGECIEVTNRVDIN